MIDVPLKAMNPLFVIGNLNFGIADAAETRVALNDPTTTNTMLNNRAVFMFAAPYSRNEYDLT